MGCNCKNIIENFQGGQIPLSTTFLSSVAFNSSVSIAGTLTSNGMSVFNGLNFFMGDTLHYGTTTFVGGVTADTMNVNDMWVSNSLTSSDITSNNNIIVNGDISFPLTCNNQDSTGLTQSVTAHSVSGIISLTKEDYSATMPVDTGAHFTVFNSYVKYNSMVMLTVNQPIQPLNANLTASVTNVMDGSFDIKIYNGGVQPILLSGGVGVNYFVMSDTGPNDKCIKPTPMTRHFSCCTTNDLSTNCSGSTNVILINEPATGVTKLNVVSEAFWEYLSSPSVGETVSIHDDNDNQTCWTYIGKHLGTATTVSYPTIPAFTKTSSCGTCTIPYGRHYSCCDSNVSGFTCTGATNMLLIDSSITGFAGDKKLSELTWVSFGSPSVGTIVSTISGVSGSSEYTCWEYLGDSLSGGTVQYMSGASTTFVTCSACTISFSGI
tara:strand:+ start:3814 stop:5118 length:1305 start_codon:yes stop_codon:yes gene_type:complete